MGAIVMGLLYIGAGINHFINPRFYLKIMPPYLPAHSLLVTLSGLAEVLLGALMLVPATRTWAAWGIILLLIAVFPANWYMAYDARFQSISPWIRWGRLPLQLVLIGWAYSYTRA